MIPQAGSEGHGTAAEFALGVFILGEGDGGVVRPSRSRAEVDERVIIGFVQPSGASDDLGMGLPSGHAHHGSFRPGFGVSQGLVPISAAIGAGRD